MAECRFIGTGIDVVQIGEKDEEVMYPSHLLLHFPRYLSSLARHTPRLIYSRLTARPGYDFAAKRGRGRIREGVIDGMRVQK